MLGVKLLFYSKAFSRLNIPQAGLCDKKLLLGVENRNHVWRDLSRLVDSEYNGL